MNKTREVQVNEQGRRIGETHPRAKFTDHEIDLIRELAEEGMTYREICAKFEIPQTEGGREYVGKIVRCEKRAHIPAKAKRITEKAAAGQIVPRAEVKGGTMQLPVRRRGLRLHGD